MEMIILPTRDLEAGEGEHKFPLYIYLSLSGAGAPSQRGAKRNILAIQLLFIKEKLFKFEAMLDYFL